MVKVRVGAKFLAGLAVWGGLGTLAAAAPTVEQMLAFKPRQPGVPHSTPSEAELAACKVELVKGTGNGSGWLMRDARGQPVRRFFDTDGDKQIDVWSYYQDGQETYREIDSNYNNKVDQFRWMGVAGSRWGVSTKEDGRIDAWKAISPEEVSQEVLQAVITRDTARLQALMLTEADIRELSLPDSEANRYRESLQAAPVKFQKLAASLIDLDSKTEWMHLETKAPQCIPADALGSKADLIRYANGALLYGSGTKHDWLQTGPLVLVGKAWKIVDAPTSGYGTEPADPGLKSGHAFAVTDEIKSELEELRAVDEKAPSLAGGTPNPDVVRYNLARAAVLQKIVAKTKGEQQANWVKQVSDCYSAAAQNSPAGDNAAYKALVALRDQVAQSAPGSSLAAYIAFREMSAEYSVKLMTLKPSEMSKVQDDWRERLKKFVDSYPTAEDTPDALLQLGMVSEFVGKETEAKNWYGHLAKHFPKHPLAAKASGASRRLELEDKVLELAGPQLGSGTAFDIAKLRGKTVVVYYWASWNAQCDSDFAKLKTLMNTYGPKGVELVCVNLDNAAGAALEFLQRTPVPGTHLFQQPGGLDSPLAVNYGVMVLPHLFLVDQEGKAASTNVQIANLEDEIKKLVK